MTRLALAQAEFVAALLEEKETVERKLGMLMEIMPSPSQAPPPRPRKAAAVKTERGKKGKKGKAPKPVEKKTQPHGVPGSPGKLSDGSPSGRTGDNECRQCGKKHLKKQRGPGGHMVYHRAPAPCLLPCAGANLKTMSREDLAEGVHSEKECPKCTKPASA